MHSVLVLILHRWIFLFDWLVLIKITYNFATVDPNVNIKILKSEADVFMEV